MEEFIKFQNSLPEKFDEETQRRKFVELAQLKHEFERTKDPRDEARYLALRGGIIEHNLRRASKTLC